MEVKALIKSLMPPVLHGVVRRLAGGGLRFTGPFVDWETARRASSGYATPAILERARTATHEVVAGRAAFERDSVLFQSVAYRFPLLAALLHAASMRGGRLHVIDLGGSLGSVYWQYRGLFSGLADLRWIVVEQPGYVDVGRREFSGGALDFVHSLDEAAARVQSPLVLAGSVLQYVPDAPVVLERIANTGALALLLDRTPMSDVAEDRVCVQHVPRQIYDASYPCWVFSRERMRERLDTHWQQLWDVPCDEGRHRSSGGLHFEFEGRFLERRH